MAQDNLFQQLGNQLGRIVTDSAAREDISKSMNTIAQNAFSRLDLVTRDELDAHLESLHSAERRIAELEAEISTLSAQLEALENAAK